MPALILLAGRRFGRLLVLDDFKSGRRSNRQQVFWWCRCDCGTEKWVFGESLRSGATLSCGCLHDERTAENREKWRQTRPRSAKFPHLKSRTPEYQAAASRQYHHDNKERVRERHRAWCQSERGHALIRASADRNYDPIKMQAYNRQRYLDNPGRYRGYVIKRLHRLEQRTPAWVDHTELDRIYRERPEGMEVDHIVPLKGRTVEGYRISGLHVPWNLQYLTEKENNRKRSRMRPEDVIC